MVQVAGGYGHTLGLRANGTVVAVGLNDEGQSNVGDWTDISQLAAGSFHTVGLKGDGAVVAAGPEIELAKWNLGVVRYTLSISSTGSGSVTAPGEGLFTYSAGTVVRLVARPDNGYRVVRWTGDVGAVANVSAATTVITVRGNYTVAANFPVSPLLIGGIVAAVVVAVGLAVFFVRRRRTAPTKRRRTGR